MERRAKPATSKPVTAPALKAIFKPCAKLCIADCVVRTLDLTEIFIPTKPAAPEKKAPMKKPIPELRPKIIQIKKNIIVPTIPIVIYWRFK